MEFIQRLFHAGANALSCKRALSISALIAAQVFSVASADDTDIFFSELQGDPSTHPNVVFVLDNSGSMGWELEGGGQRMQAMQEAMINIIDSVENVNIGMVNFFQSNRGREVYPVTPIEAPGARQDMRDVVNAMRPRGGTPLVAAFHESTKIIRGGQRENTSASYTSPMVGECQRNHIVMLSDGAATGRHAVERIENLIGRNCVVRNWWGSGSTCGLELAQWIKANDHSASIPGDQNITVSTVGFNISSDFLESVAAAGGGEYYEADDAEQLVDAFNDIITSVKDDGAMFVGAATSISQFNRLTQSNNLYFSMFKPLSSASWPGNLKRFQLGFQAGEVTILDANGNPAIDEATGVFRDTARSFWSDVQDGAEVELGGAAGELVSAARRVYTHMGPIPNEGVELNELLTPNSPVVTTHLATMTDADRELAIRWIRGEDVNDEVAGLERRHMGDVLHSSPVTVNYGSKSLVYLGTNEGFLHAIRESDGVEEFSFMPEELVSNIRDFYSDTGASNRPYGLDGGITLEHIDNNGDNIVNGSDDAYLYIGMRRGGNDYYALDVTNPEKPRLMWKIDGGTGDYQRLGQTWSKPIPTDIYYKGQKRPVLIFGGGYDTNQDPENNPNGTDSVGNTVFIADARTGERLWSAFDHASGVSTDMQHSIPSNLRIIDINGDALADRIYVGDLGGRVWRFDIKPYHQSGDSVSNLVEATLLAELKPSSNGRSRFFNEPDVAFISHEGERFMSVGIGSGWRAHPLSTVDNDYFYMVRDTHPLTTPTAWTPIRFNQLQDVTNSLSTSPSRNGVADPEGWKLRLAENGEKNLSRSITINNQILFSSYAPIASNDYCAPPSGRGFVYAIDAIHGDPVIPLASGGSGGTGGPGGHSLSVSDRKVILKAASIPPEPTAAITDVGGEIRTTVMVGTEAPLQDLSFSELTKRTYWQDRKRGSSTPAACKAGHC
ncbi:MAG: PilC/PilY family type IV pilus protein [Granulosicoccus sp.]